MAENRAARPESREPVEDPYWEQLVEHWDNIRMMYELLADKRPVMLYDVQEQGIYAYPYQEFKAELNPHSQALLRSQYQRAVANRHIVVFVRDNEKEKLLSYTVDPAKMEEDVTKT
jgi:hypothetical protein